MLTFEPRAMTVMCRECGCTEADACTVDCRLDGQLEGCSWVEPELCSACGFPDARVRGPLAGAGRLRLRATMAEAATPDTTILRRGKAL